MNWVSPRAALQMIGARKLAQLTNEASQQELIGVGDTTTVAFTTPFTFGADLQVYVDAVLSDPTGYALTIDYVHGERVIVTFNAPPGLDVRITASSTDAVNADNLDAAFLRAQSLVSGALGAQMYTVPVPTDLVPMPEPVLGWAAAIAWYLLATDPRRPRLLEAYPELEKRYIDVWGGVDSDLKRVAKGNFSLSGILTRIDPPGVTTAMGSVMFSSNVPVYTNDNYRGVHG